MRYYEQPDFNLTRTRRLQMADGTLEIVKLQQRHSGKPVLMDEGHHDLYYPPIGEPKQVTGRMGAYEEWKAQEKISPAEWLKRRLARQKRE